jgi:hypothetical protein
MESFGVPLSLAIRASEFFVRSYSSIIDFHLIGAQERELSPKCRRVPQATRSHVVASITRCSIFRINHLSTIDNLPVVEPIRGKDAVIS